MQIAVVGIDLGKNSCCIVGLDDVRLLGIYTDRSHPKTGCYLLETLNLHRQNFCEICDCSRV
jgi:hypothetical protein